jgi:hypothetical protein
MHSGEAWLTTAQNMPTALILFDKLIEVDLLYDLKVHTQPAGWDQILL